MMVETLESLKEKAVYHYQQFNECMNKIAEIDEIEASNLQQYLEEIGGC